MRASRLVAAVAAGLVSLSSASAAEPAGPTKEGGGEAGVAAPQVVAATTPLDANRPGERAAGTAASPVADPAPGAEASSRKAADEAPQPSVAKKPLPPTLIVKINLSSQSLTVSHGGVVRDTWKISSGREGYATPRGVFRPQWAAKMWYSRKYDMAPMPHAVFFVGGVAVHGTQSVRMLGMPASHGCVRLAPANAAKLYGLVHKHGYARTRIEVFGTPPASRVAKRRAPVPAQADAVVSHRLSAQRLAEGRGRGSYGWASPKPAPRLRVQSNGLIYLPPDSGLRGRETFVYNGVIYRRIR